MKCDACKKKSQDRVHIKIYKENKRIFKATLCHSCFFSFKNTTVRDLGHPDHRNDNKR